MITTEQLKALINAITTDVETEYSNIVSSLETYQNLNAAVSTTNRYAALKNLYHNVLVYLKQHPNSPKNRILSNLRTECLSELAEMFNNTIKPIKKEVIVSDLTQRFGDIRETYYDFWKTLNPDHTFQFYYDSEAFAANMLLEFLEEHIGKVAMQEILNEFTEVGEEHGELFAEKRIRKMYVAKKEVKQFFTEKRNTNPNLSPSEIIKEFLIAKYQWQPEQIEAKRVIYISDYEDMGAIDIRRNISSAFDDSIYRIYEKELFVNLNILDADSILRYSLLDKLGGISLDSNYLPQIKDHVFRDIEFPQDAPEEIIRLKMIGIMKNKEYVFGYDMAGDDADMYDALSDDIKQSMQQELDAVHNPSELFESIKHLQVSELSFITDLKNTVTVTAPLIAAHENSVGTQAILNQIKSKYSLLNSVYDKITEENDTYNTARRNLFKVIQQTTNDDVRFFLLDTRYYMDCNFSHVRHEFLPTMHLTGNSVLLSASKNIIQFEDSIASVPAPEIPDLDLSAFQLPENTVTYYSQLAEYIDSLNYERKDEIDFENTAQKENIEIRKSEDFDTGKPLETEGLTELCNTMERFVFEKAYLSVILQVENETITNKFTAIKFAKHAESSIIVQTTIDQENMYYFDPITKKVVKAPIADGLPVHLRGFEKMKLTVIGHGGGGRRLAEMNPTQLLEHLSPITAKFKIILPEMKKLEVNLFACKLLKLSLPSLKDSYPARFLFQVNRTENPIKALVNGEIENISIAASPYEITVFDGRFATIVDHEEMPYTRDELKLRGIVPKYLMQYENGVLTLKPKEIKESFEARNVLEKAFKSSIQSSMEAAADPLSDVNLDDLGVFLDHENIAESSLVGQTRRRNALSDVQKKSIEFSDFMQTVDQLDQKVFQLKQQHGLTENDIVILDSIEERDGKHFIKFASKLNGEVKEIETPLNETFKEYKELSESKIRPLIEHITKLSDEKFTYNQIHIEDAVHISTLNAAFLVQMLLEFVQSDRDINQLSTAVKVQIYTQMTSTSLRLATDAANVINIIKQAEQTQLQLLPRLVQAINVLAFILDGITLGAAIYGLINATDELEKKVLASSVGMISVNFALGLGSTASYLLGASTAAEVLGVLAVPLIGLTIGLGSLVNNILKIEHDAGQVVEFFKMLGKVEKEGYYSLDSEQKVLTPSPLVPVERIDLRYKDIKFGSIKITKTTDGSIVSNGSYPHYFASPNASNKEPGISISDVLFPENISQNILENDSLILPSALNVRYFTQYNWVAGSRYWTGEGVNVLERLRERYDRSFHWRYYATGGERAITKLDPGYEDTTVQVFCDVKDRTFISSIIEEKNASAKLKYAIYYNSSKYTYVCQHTPIAVSFMPLDWNTAYNTGLNLKIDNLVYETKLENGKIVQDEKLKKLGDIIKIRQYDTQYKNVVLYGLRENQKENDILKALEIKIGDQIVNFYGKTHETIYLSFHSKDFQICLKVDPKNACIEKILVFGNMENFETSQLSQLSYLQNYNLSEDLLKDIQIVLNEGADNKKEPIVRGSVDIINNGYMLLLDKEEEDSKHTYTHIVKDANLGAEEIVLKSTDEKTTVFKKPKEIKEGNQVKIVNDYFVKGYAIPKINNSVFGTSKYKENEYLLQISGKDRFVLKNIFLVDLFMNEELSILGGIPTIFEVFGLNEDVDPRTEDGKNKIMAALQTLITQYAIRDSITPKETTNSFSITLDPKLVISGVDEWNRNLNILFNQTSYALNSGYWLSEEREVVFYYNLLSSKELAVSKQQNAKDLHTIEVTNNDSILLNYYMESMLVICDDKTEVIKLEELNTKVLGVDSLKEINILLPVKSNTNAVLIKLPFLKKDLTWDTDGTNFMMEVTVNGVNKKITILDAFHAKHSDKKLSISLKDQKNQDLPSFMKS